MEKARRRKKESAKASKLTSPLTSVGPPSTSSSQPLATLSESHGEGEGQTRTNRTGELSPPQPAPLSSEPPSPPPQLTAVSAASPSISPTAVNVMNALTSGGTLTQNHEVWRRLTDLQTLLDTKLIDRAEYDRRKHQLVDELTGTKLTAPIELEKTQRKDDKKQQQTSPKQSSSSLSGAAQHEKESIALTSTNNSKPSNNNNAANSPTNNNKNADDDMEYSDHSAAHHNHDLLLKPFIPRPPPDFTEIPAERALLLAFDIHSKQWSHYQVSVKIEPNSFARGSLRLAYHMSRPVPIDNKADAQLAKRGVTGGSTTYVAKISIDPYEDNESYYQDVIIQSYARHYADKYNSYNPPKKVDFIMAYLLELLERSSQPLCAVERFIPGPYRKHNNNFGYVSDDERNTPQAFSHFTYEASGHTILICDIQGVADSYTDPQIHSRDGIGYGKGNMGERGFDKFLTTHRCNAICRYLKLPMLNAKSGGEDSGTLPATMYMSYHAVEVVHVHVKAEQMTPRAIGLSPLPPRITQATVTPKMNVNSRERLPLLQSAAGGSKSNRGHHRITSTLQDKLREQNQRCTFCCIS